MDDLLILDHVHWDREWYRPHEAFRARLVELVEAVVGELERGERPLFHLDGQTITVADVLEVRPELEERLRDLVMSGRLTIGPWHVLADNQLVSGECLVRNLLLAHRWGQRLGGLSGEGYSPDAFGHPADLPRILTGFGISTALVWRGAPPEHASFLWRSPDGSEVLALNQRYHEVELLWDADAAASVRSFVDAQKVRRPHGPWLLMNGGDHLLPRRPAERTQTFEQSDVNPVPVALRDIFDHARAATADNPLPVVEGELRRVGDHLTFLLPGTLSARMYLKQANYHAQTTLTDWVEPLLVLAPSPETPGLLRHAWDLMVQNAPHDSVCGCSVDEVHRENVVRAQRVGQLAEHLIERCLHRLGFDCRRPQDGPAQETHILVSNPHAFPVTQGVDVTLVTSVDSWPASLTDGTGWDVPFDADDLGCDVAFEADLDLLATTAQVRKHLVSFVATAVPAKSHAIFSVRLGSTEPPVAPWQETVAAPMGAVLVEAADDGSFALRDDEGRQLRGLGRLVDGGDRGDTYNWDPPAGDRLCSPELISSSQQEGRARSRYQLRSVLTVPAHLSADRLTRSTATVDLPITTILTHWHGVSGLRLSIEIDNQAEDHRLRMHFPASAPATEWTSDAAYSMIQRPLGAVLGPLPQNDGFEAAIGVAPVQSVAAIGVGPERVAITCPGLPEVQGLEGTADQSAELAVTLLRAVGWLSRFDLRTRTGGAGPQLATPGAQCPGVATYEIGLHWGSPIADDLALAQEAARSRAPLRARQLFHPPATAVHEPVLQAEGALVTAWKPAEDNDGSILRVSNLTADARTVRLSGRALSETRRYELSTFDERRATPQPLVRGEGLTITLRPFETTTIRLLSDDSSTPAVVAVRKAIV